MQLTHPNNLNLTQKVIFNSLLGSKSPLTLPHLTCQMRDVREAHPQLLQKLLSPINAAMQPVKQRAFTV